MKTTLHLNPVNGGPLNCRPAFDVELEPEKILCNDVHLPWEINYHRVHLYVIGNEFGAICAVWAGCEHDALDEMVDSGLGDSFLVSGEYQAAASEEEREEWACLGNAGEPADLTYAWLQPVRLDESKDCRLISAFAEARGANQTTLDR